MKNSPIFEKIIFAKKMKNEKWCLFFGLLKKNGVVLSSRTLSWCINNEVVDVVSGIYYKKSSHILLLLVLEVLKTTHTTLF